MNLIKNLKFKFDFWMSITILLIGTLSNNNIIILMAFVVIMARDIKLYIDEKFDELKDK